MGLCSVCEPHSSAAAADSGMEYVNATSVESEFSEYDGYQRDTVNWPGLGGVLGFYVVILGMGFYASWKAKSFRQDCTIEELTLAGRNIGPLMGIFTMTASWLGGGYLNGTAEILFTPGQGLAWDTPTWTYALGLLLGGVFFAKKMRKARYVTLLGPFEARYGSVMAALNFIPACMGEIFYCGCILSALGASLTVIIGLKHSISVLVSVGVAVLYTLIGGLYSVAFTDIMQLTCTFAGLILAIPFAMQHPAVGPIGETAFGMDGWIGTVETSHLAVWVDSVLQLTLGGIPWQGYFQRVLSSRSPQLAQVLSLGACVGLCLGTIPPVLIGAIAKSTDWNATAYALHGQIPVPEVDYKFMLPFVMEFLCPLPVAVIGLGAVSAAVMSSADSAILSASSMFAINVYTPFKNKALATCTANHSKYQTSERDTLWMMRACIIVVGICAAAMAIYVKSIFGLFFLCTDLVYVILFPQLLCAVHVPMTNSYGSFCGWLVAVVMRALSGEPVLSLPAFIQYPAYSAETGEQLFPFKTLIMLLSLATILIVSKLAEFLFRRGVVPQKWDVFEYYVDGFQDGKDEECCEPWLLKKALKNGVGVADDESWSNDAGEGTEEKKDEGRDEGTNGHITFSCGATSSVV